MKEYARSIYPRFSWNGYSLNICHNFQEFLGESPLYSFKYLLANDCPIDGKKTMVIREFFPPYITNYLFAAVYFLEL